MLKVSELLSKPLLSLFEAKEEGVIKNVLFDAKTRTAKAAELFCEAENEPEEKYVLFKDFFNIGTDGVVIKNSSYISLVRPAGLFSCPINADIYTTDGKRMGKVTDVYLTEKYAAESLETEKGPLKIAEVASLSQNVVIVQNTDNPVRLTRPPQKIPREDSRRVYIQAPAPAPRTPAAPAAIYAPVEVPQPPRHAPASAPRAVPAPTPVKPAPAQSAAPYSEGRIIPENYAYYRAIIENTGLRARPYTGEVTVPERILPAATQVSRSPQEATAQSNNYQFLLGRVTTAEVVDNSGKVIIKSGVTITPKHVEKAKEQGKIVQLALCLTPAEGKQGEV